MTEQLPKEIHAVDIAAIREVQRVIRIARSETRRMLDIYDKHIAALFNITASKGDASNG